MIRKSAQYEHAKELRKRGFTYDEIAKIVNISKSTISHWLSREAWSTQVKIDNAKRAARENSKRISLLNKARRNQNNKIYAEAEHSALVEFKHYAHSPLFVAGISLYMALGDHHDSSTIRISSRHLESHRIFIAFVTEFLGVPREKIRFWLILYPNLDPERCSRMWSKKIKIPISQFHKYQIVPIQTTKGALRYGVGNTIIGGTVSKKKLMKWVNLLQKKL